MKRYRFYIIENGRTYYLRPDLETYTPERHEAQLFTDKEWYGWAQEQEFQREEIAEDEAMRLAGAPRLPGMEG